MEWLCVNIVVTPLTVVDGVPSASREQSPHEDTFSRIRLGGKVLTRYTKDMIVKICNDVKGKKIECMEYCEEDDYFTITLDTGPEFSFRFMADLIR